MKHTPSLALRSLLARPVRTLLTTSGIILGVAVILAISITNLSTMKSIATLFNEASGKAHLVVTSSWTGDPGFPQDVMDRIANQPGVKALVPTLHVQTLLADELTPAEIGVSLFGAVRGSLALYGIDPALDVEAREYKIVEGKFLSSREPEAYDVVLVQDFAAEKELQVGDQLRIVVPGGTEELRVVGLMSKEGPGQINNGAFGVIPLQTAQALYSRSGELDQIDIVALPEAASGQDLDKLQASLQARLGSDYAVVYPASQGKRVTQMLDTYQLGLNFFSVVALFVGGFLIYNAFSMTVVERTREIGMLRTLGMTRGQVMRQILTEASIVAVIGSALGVGTGVLLARGLIRLMELLVAQEVVQTQVPLDGLITSVFVGIGVTIVAAGLPAWQAGRISPLEALRIRGSSRENWVVVKGWRVGLALCVVSLILILFRPFPVAVQYHLSQAAVFGLFVGVTLLIPVTVSAWERVTRTPMRRIYGAEGQLGSRNTQRARFRTALTVAALMVGAAMILGVRGMTDAFKHDITSWIEVYIGGDLYVYSSMPMRADLARRLEGVDGVAAATPFRYVDAEATRPDGKSEWLIFTGLDPESHEQVTSFIFAAGQGDPAQLLSRLAAGDAIFISSVLSERYGLKKGDTLRLSTKRGKHDFEIAAVVVDFYNQGLIVDGNWSDLRRYFGVNDVNSFLLKIEPGRPVDAIKADIDRLYSQRYHLTTESNKALKARALQLASQAFSMFDVLALIAMIVAALGVVNTLMMNVLERTREIGMLRSLGMTRRQVAKMILAEAGLIGIIGGVFGLGFGLFLSRLILTAANAIQGYDLTYVLPKEGIVISLFIALITSQIAAIWPARRAAGIRIIEAIQFE